MNNFTCRERVFCSLSDLVYWLHCKQSPGPQLRDLCTLLHILHSKNHPATALGGWLCAKWPFCFVMCCQRTWHWKTYEMVGGLMRRSSLLVEVQLSWGYVDQNQPWDLYKKFKGHNPISLKTNSKFLLTWHFSVLVLHNRARDCPSLQRFWETTSLATLKWCLYDVKNTFTEITNGIRL